MSGLLRFLTRVSRQLAESTSYEEALENVAAQALPYVGSWCIVDVVEWKREGEFRRLAVIHPDPDLQPHADRLTKSWPPERDDPLGAPRAVRLGRTELISEVDDEMLRQVARSEQNLEDLQALGIGSVVVVPMLARGTVLGAMTFVSPEAGHTYEGSDVELAEDVAARCAIALDNARLLREAEGARDLVVGMNERLVLASLHEKDAAEEATARRDVTSRFLATLSHEIRTPINSIQGHAALLAEGVGGGELNDTQLRYARRMQESARHLSELVSDTLDLTKIEEGKMRMDVRAASGESVVSEALGMIRPLARAEGVQVPRRPSRRGEGDRYMGDEDRVRQIVLNLLSNAVKFTGEGGRVTVRCGRRERGPSARLGSDGPWMFVEVEDTGPGIPRDKLEDVFEPFVQLEDGAKRGSQGTGLGLPISRELAQRMGGDLTVRSRQSRGACFTLWLPPADPG